MAVDKERIGPGFFTDAFKNTLRDYYAYGFHEAADYPDSMSTISNNWNRLNSILHDHRFWQWADSPRGRLFVTGDSRTAPMNLFQLVYLYCGFKPEEPSRYFGTIFSLSPAVSFRRPEEELERLEDHPSYDDFEKRFRDRQAPCLSSAELDALLHDSGHLFSGNYKKTNRLLSPLRDMGIVRQEGASNDRSWSLSPCFLQGIIQAGEQGGITDRQDPLYTALPFRTRFLAALDFFSQYLPFGENGMYLMRRLRDNPHANGDPVRFVHEYFVSALNDYLLIDLLDAIERKQWQIISYSHSTRKQCGKLICLPLEIRISDANGRSYLLYYDPCDRRLGSIRLETIDEILLFRSAKDENGAIPAPHKAPWVEEDIARCREMLSVMWGAGIPSGTEGHGNAELPFTPSHVRIECTDKVRGGHRYAYRLQRERRFGQVTVDPATGHLIWEADVLQPKEMIPWICTLFGSVVRIDGLKDPAGILREAEAILTDRNSSAQSRTGLRSASVGAERMSTGHPAPLALRAGAEAEKTGEKDHPQKTPSAPHIMPWQRLLEDGTVAEGLAARNVTLQGDPLTAHSLLFSEQHGIYYHLIGRWLTEAAKLTEEDMRREPPTEKSLLAIGRRIVLDNRELTGNYTAGVCMRLLNKVIRDGVLFTPGFRRRQLPGGSVAGGSSQAVYGEFLDALPAGIGEKERSLYIECFLPRFFIAQSSVRPGTDLIPLTRPERRWLCSMLAESRLKLFLTPGEIRRLQTYMEQTAGEATAFPFEHIVHFDRFHIARYAGQKEKSQVAFRRFLQAIREQKKLSVTYRTSRGENISFVWLPVDIEYSKRNDTFHLIAVRDGTDKVDALSLARIRETALLDESYDKQAALEILREFLNTRQNGKQVTITFRASSHLEDRILTEFSPWKKTCVRVRPDEPEAGAEDVYYELTVNYLPVDEDEIIERLIAYGPAIGIREPEILLAIKRRLRMQRKLFGGDREIQEI